MGVAVKQALGDVVYTLGFTAFSGEQRQQAGRGVLPVRPAPAGSLEHELHRLGQAHLVLDLRSARWNDHWLGLRFPMRIRGYLTETLKWSHVVDGIFFNNTMTPSTWVR